MRIWDLNPNELCRKHLLGEHRELHGLWNILTQDLRGYRSHPETRRWEGKLAALYHRHQALVEEMQNRGYRHASPLDPTLVTGSEYQDEFVDAVAVQRRLLTAKPCGCMFSERLNLIPATVALCDAEFEGRAAIARALGAIVPASWPPPVLEPDDFHRIRRRVKQGADHRTWTLHYMVLRPSSDSAQPELVGVAGYASPPSDGAVEIGYAVAEEHQRRGYATEAVTALVSRAFAEPEILAVFATTYATLEPSIGVLLKAGFQYVTDSEETALVRYECRR